MKRRRSGAPSKLNYVRVKRSRWREKRNRGGHGNEQEKYFWRDDGRRRGHEGPPERQAHIAHLQGRTGAASEGGFQVDPRYAKETALLASRLCTQAADQSKDFREVGAGPREAQPSSRRACAPGSEIPRYPRTFGPRRSRVDASAGFGGLASCCP